MKKILSIYTILLLIGCANQSEDYKQAENQINDELMKNHVITLSSDEFQGRKPCTAGEIKTINYLKNEFEKLGLKPAFNGSFFQEVPLVKITTNTAEILQIKTQNKKIELKKLEDFVAFSMRLSKNIELKNSEVVFAGFGIVAPEYNWNDYSGIDVKGKTVIVLVNDPGFATKDTNLFKGNTMTYYGRWTYKYEEAARQGAAACFIVHQTDAAGYPFTVPSNRAASENFYLRPTDNYESRCAVEGWITLEATKNLFSNLNLDFSKEYESATHRNFKPFKLKAEINFSLTNEYEFITTNNVGAIYAGTTQADECIVFTAHWDHFGIGTPENGDSIYHGAVDNGTSIAWLMEIAKGFTKLKQKTKRSVLFLFPTCEEQGLLGSAYYVEHPVFDIKKTVACFNNDLMLPIGKMKDVMITGYGQSELDDFVAVEAKKQDRYILPDPNSHTGMYFRSDHFSFAKVGVPSLYARGNCDSRQFGKEYAASKEKQYISNQYHRPADKYDEKTWNFEGIIEDAKLSFSIGYKLCTENIYPKWKNTSEFKNKR